MDVLEGIGHIALGHSHNKRWGAVDELEMKIDEDEIKVGDGGRTIPLTIA